ncbi:MAG: hypothetical protein LLF97_13230 [Planctomycetaceae bacterium]|nr:hypothetical protein [Planctomycetaceae bacterium]
MALKPCRLIAAVLIGALACRSLAASPSGGDPAAPSSEALPVEESRPSIFYLPDAQNRLQPVLDFKYQDFVELYRLKNRLTRRSDPPRYSLQRMTATGVAGEEFAELSVQFQILVRDDGWVRIPLELAPGLLRGEPQYHGSGEQFLQDDGNGYVCWIRGKANSQHEITLTLLTPLTAVGDETRLQLFAPRAVTSELRLTASSSPLVGRVSEGATLLSTTVRRSGATEFNVVGLGGDFQLVWRKVSPHAVDTAPALEASATVLTKLDARSISAEATLSVRSHGEAFDHFLVRLPPGMEATFDSANGYVVAPVDAAAKNKDPSRWVEVRLPKKTAGPVDVRIACRCGYDPTKDPSWRPLAGFEVVGAIRQWGTVGVAVGGDWQILWGPTSDARQLDALPAPLRKDEVVACFEYSCQPYSLNARLAPRKTRLSVEPKYVVSVDRNAVRLSGKLTCTVRGAKLATLLLNLGDWELEEVGPEDLVAVDGVTSSGAEVAVPLVHPSSGALELELRAHRRLTPDAHVLQFALPQVHGGSSGPAGLILVPDDNVELTPNNARSEGLVRQPTSPFHPTLPKRQQAPLYYRSTGGQAVFVADLRVHRQRVTVDASSRAAIGPREAEVEQRFSYAIAYEPADRLTLAVPGSPAWLRSARLLCDGKPLAPTAVSEERRGDGTAPSLVRIALPGPRIGPCEIVLRYSVPFVEPTPDRSTAFALPLAMPQDGTLLSNTLTIQPSRGLRIALRKEGVWTATPHDVESNADSLWLTAARPSCQVELDLRRRADATQTAVIDRAWIQSWLTSSARQDRAVYRIATERRSLEFEMPKGVALNDVVAWVDGACVPTGVATDRRLRLTLPETRRGRPCTVELQYHFAESRPPCGRMQLGFPRPVPAVWIRRLYWQLVLPANEHLLVNPVGLTGEFQWGWAGWFLGRHPRLDQSSLAAWTGVDARTSPSERSNVYLFSAFGDIATAELRTAGRTALVFWASGAAMLVGLLLIHVPAVRHPIALLVLATALVAAALIAPEPTFLLGQAASLGVALALAAGWLKRLTARRRRQMILHGDLSDLRVEVGSTRAVQPLPPVVQPSTDAMPATSPPPGSVEP